MENFTDLFGDDLTGLDGLGDLGNFGGANTGAPGGPPANAPQVHTYLICINFWTVKFVLSLVLVDHFTDKKREDNTKFDTNLNLQSVLIYY